MSMSLKEYEVDDERIDEWLPWGGITAPHVVQQKDGSFLSVIEYQPYISSNDKKIKYREYKNGWSIWSEKQHLTKDRQFFVVCWNPFYNIQHKVENALVPNVQSGKELNYFSKEVENIAADISEVTSCKILEYQDILDFLYFSLSFSGEQIPMPDIPLYLDALLSQDLAISFLDNNITIGDNTVLVLSLTGCPDKTVINKFANVFKTVPYRYVRRMLLFDKKNAAANLKKYTARWCSNRETLREMILSDILSDLNGYYSEAFFILLDSKLYDEAVHYCQNIINDMGISCIIESYNLKDIWWGSIPGVFRANITPPLTGFPYLDDFLSVAEPSAKAEPVKDK